MQSINSLAEKAINYLRFREVIGKTKGKNSWLDLGCGDGKIAFLAAKQGYKVIAVDKHLKIVLPHKSNLLANLKFIQSSIEDFNPQQQFDIITMYHVLEHVKDPELVLKRVKSWLRRKGVLILEVPLVGNWTEKFLKKDYFIYYDKSHRHFFTKKKLLALIEKSGFKVVTKGVTLYEFPFTVITTSSKENLFRLIMGLTLFLPLKLLTLLGVNEEIIRLYCKPVKYL